MSKKQKPKDELNPKQRKFVEKIVEGKNQTQAAIEAGYSPNCATVNASRLLTNAKVRNEVDKKVQTAAEKLGITAEFVLGGMKEIFERCSQRVPVMVFDRETKEYYQKIDEKTGEGVWEFDSTGANKSLENLAKHLRLLTDKIEVSADDSLFDRLKSARERIKQEEK
jgi:hypothetical protein